MLCVCLTGCANYIYKHADVDGSSCELTIWSMREIQAGDIRISKKCTLTGGADAMTYNQLQMEALTSLISKIP